MVQSYCNRLWTPHNRNDVDDEEISSLFDRCAESVFKCTVGVAQPVRLIPWQSGAVLPYLVHFNF